MKPFLSFAGLVMLLLAGCQSQTLAPQHKPWTITAFSTVGADGRPVRLAEDCPDGIDLLDRMFAADGPDEIWATFGFEVRLKAGRAQLSCTPWDAGDEMDSHEYECPISFVRDLTPAEVADLRRSPTMRYADTLPNLVYNGTDQPQVYYFHLSARGAHALYMNGLEGESSLYLHLVQYFGNLCHSAPMTARYVLPRPIPGLELIWADPTMPARAAWACGNDVRLLLTDETICTWGVTESDPRWCGITPGVAHPTTRPSTMPAEFPPGAYAQILDISFSAATRAWHLEAAGRRVRHAEGEHANSDDVCLFEGSSAPIPLFEGDLEGALMTQDGRYLATVQEYNSKMVLYDLDTRTTIPIDSKTAADFRPTAYVASLGKILLDSSGSGPPWALLDPATGRVSNLPPGADASPYGDHWHPLMHRDLQPTGEPGVVWAAMPGRKPRYSKDFDGTWVCRYDTRTFHVLNRFYLRGLVFDSNHMWVDQSTGRVYLVHDGAVFRVPLPPEIYRDVPLVTDPLPLDVPVDPFAPP